MLPCWLLSWAIADLGAVSFSSAYILPYLQSVRNQKVMPRCPYTIAYDHEQTFSFHLKRNYVNVITKPEQLNNIPEWNLFLLLLNCLVQYNLNMHKNKFC